MGFTLVTASRPETDPLDVFSRVISHLALYARDLSAKVYESEELVSLELNNGIDTTVQWPFICAYGHVRHDVKPPIDVGGMVRNVMRCGLHSYDPGGPTCKLHPVCDDGIIAAYMLGGAEAVVGMQAKWAYARHIFTAWRAVLDSFAHTIIAHDKRMSDPDPNMLTLAALDSVPVPKDQQVDTKFGRLESFTVIVRPGDPIRSKRRRKKHR